MKRLFTKALVAACALAIAASAIFAAAAVDLNTASQKDLEGLKGVGAATAKKIIAGRPYTSVDGLSKAGLSAKLIADLKPLVTVSAPAAAAPSTTAAPKAEAAPSVAKAAPKPAAAPAGPVDLNTASQKDLEALKGVGPATAAKIIAGRPYASVDGLSKAGLSAKLVAGLKPYVTASAAAAKATTAPAAAPQKTVAVPPPAPAPKTAATPASATQSTTTPATTGTGTPAAKSAAASKPAATKLAPGQTVNINTASKEELDLLPEIGPVKAQAIIDGRPYAKIEDVMKVKGIKQATFDKIKNLITVH